jgi:hypothetical protein
MWPINRTEKKKEMGRLTFTSPTEHNEI